MKKEQKEKKQKIIQEIKRTFSRNGVFVFGFITIFFVIGIIWNVALGWKLENQNERMRLMEENS